MPLEQLKRSEVVDTIIQDLRNSNESELRYSKTPSHASKTETSASLRLISNVYNKILWAKSNDIDESNRTGFGNQPIPINTAAPKARD